MGGIVFLIILAIIFFVLGIALYSGRASWTIAGYNTASEEEKKKYDEKKLCKSMGIFCIIVTVLIGIMTYFAYQVEGGKMSESDLLPIAGLFIIVILLSVIIEIIYTNKYCKKNDTH
jgi:cytochrome bd-type quinol oxidase subunit 1